MENITRNEKILHVGIYVHYDGYAAHPNFQRHFIARWRFFRICKKTRYSNHIYFFRPDTRFLFIKEVSTRLFSKKNLVFF